MKLRVITGFDESVVFESRKDLSNYLRKNKLQDKYWNFKSPQIIRIDTGLLRVSVNSTTWNLKLTDEGIEIWPKKGHHGSLQNAKIPWTAIESMEPEWDPFYD